MDVPAPAWSHQAMIDAMILRAEAACERYRRSAERKCANEYVAQARRQTLQQMERALSRLQAERQVAVPTEQGSVIALCSTTPDC